MANEESISRSFKDQQIHRLKKEVEELEAEIKDIKDAYAIVMNEECANDEVHCTCVPALRAEIKQLEVKL